MPQGHWYHMVPRCAPVSTRTVATEEEPYYFTPDRMFWIVTHRWGTTEYEGTPESDGSTHTGAATAALYNATHGQYMNFSRATAGVMGMDRVEEWRRYDEPDGTWVMATGADLTQTRVWVGFASNAGTTYGDTPNFVMAAFRYSPTSAGDTTWQAYVADGTGASSYTLVDTGVAVATDTRYVMRVSCLDPSVIKFYINGTRVAKVSSYMPALSATIMSMCHSEVITNVSRDINWRKTFVTTI